MNRRNKKRETPVYLTLKGERQRDAFDNARMSRLDYSFRETNPLDGLVSKNHYEILKYFIEQGADIKAPDEGETLIHVAAFMNRTNVLQYLVGE